MIDRIKTLMKFENLSSSQFADEINIQRSSLSHVLSGRNKPSLDFVMKIKQCFNNVRLDWILLGEGEMLIAEESSGLSAHTNRQINHNTDLETGNSNTINIEGSSSTSGNKVENNSNVIDDIPMNSKNSIHKILIFFSDGTYKEFK
ncbi:MAG: helix-turn-helix transcriptional regulator [Bacteroidales bacterium]|jgi:transcriptional regulator with XRE-family HTH domain|nr:helix-turn-helix transcriptional regulator [Bacteroidales bacterium]MDG2080275.1 helix-turn-helix transcriptional regulator [Bacteroidales bacterium]|tara:strand:+ start:5581 stop:6018 length:438 start_codon:yes stop_codon:yes gene_type:complete